MLTPGEASEILNIPASTLRRYAKLFGDYLSVEASRSRARRYNDADITTLARIRELTQNQGVKLADVPEHLDLVISAETASESLLPAVLDTIRTIQTENQNTQNELAILREDFATLRAELAELRAAKKPFWERIFRRAND